MIDCHLHLQDPRFDGERDEIIATMRSLGIRRCVVNGTHPDDWDAVEAMARDYPEVIPFFGLHPWKVGTEREGWLADLQGRLERNPGAGIGEIGLDRWIQGGDFPLQRRVFAAQLELARATGRPVAIHCLQAWGTLAGQIATADLRKGFLLHSYGGPGEMVDEFAAMGAFFSLSGYFSRPEKEAKLRVFDQVPLDRLLLETDAPDMMPPPDRVRYRLATDSASAVNHPGNLVAIYEAFAARLSLSVPETERLVEANFERWYGQGRRSGVSPT